MARAFAEARGIAAANVPDLASVTCGSHLFSVEYLDMRFTRAGRRSPVILACRSEIFQEVAMAGNPAKAKLQLLP